MAQFLKEHRKYKEFDKLYIFANTGKELPETLDFINKCDKEWSLGIVWIEAFVNPERGEGTSYKVVNYDRANRTGKPFEDVIRKYGMPNFMGSHCTREMKMNPISKYVKDLGYDEVYKAMGIRYDERHRESNNAKKDNIIYPLIYDIKVDQRFVRSWWDRQPFDLDLKDYEGNCDLCFKKSLKKRLTIINERPDISDWWQKMEEKFGNEKIPRFDLRTNMSIEEMVEMSKNPFQKAEDLHNLSKKQYDLFNAENDCFCKIS